MHGNRVAPAVRSGRAQVCVAIDSQSLSRVARRALRDSGLESCNARDLASDRPTTVVCGWVGRPLTEQRRHGREAVARFGPHRVVLITDLDQQGALQRLVGDGVHGIVLRGQIESALAATVRAVAAGQLCVSELARAAIQRRPLSIREREILALVIMGLSNGEIASRLHLAESTVKSHLASTFGKLGVRSRGEAAELVSDPQLMLRAGVLGLSDHVADGQST
jgi:DNA-binding NarL/FixJ family response regulator